VTKAISRKPKMVESHGGDVPASVLLGLGVGTEADIANRKSHHELEHEGEGHDHDHDEFESFVVEYGPVADPSAFAASLKAIIETHDILRLKGFADVPGKPMRLVIQAVGNRIDTYFDRPWKADETRATRLVVIGLHDEMDDQAIIRAIGDI
jgi:cobalamin biosynthesis protein CobW